ncbi:sensor histidine kinase [Melittangium boletus]|uniref:sensor histidine kinase n=1 Tax=Melittangium boletus TaxID=83453 RepID=UPI0014754BF1|nr:ATP-binding protein [Melittangium boletus]
MAEFLREHRELLLLDWETTLRERAPEQPHEEAVLRDHLPEFLERLADAAEHPSAEGVSLPLALSDEHALLRLEHGQGLSQIALEYAILRHCIFRGLMREGLWPGLSELELLNNILDQGLIRATTLYSHVHERMLKALERVSEATLESEDIDSFLPKLLRVLQEAVMAVDGASILLREGNELRLRAAVGIGSHRAMESGFHLPVDAGLSGQVAHERRPQLVRMVANHPELRSELVRQLGVRAAYSIPLLQGDTLIGVAHMCSRTVFDFSPSDQLLFRVMMTRATSFIVQAELAERERLARATAQRSLAQLDTLLEASPVGIGLLDRELRVLSINETLAQLNGPPVAEQLGRSLREVAPAWVAELLEPVFRHVLDSGQPVSNHEFTGQPLDTSPHHWLGNYYPVRAADGAVVGLGCVLVDITHQKDVETALRRSGELREQLIGVVGHDLRNPLNAISASATLLRRDASLSDGSRRAVERIRNSAARMARMLSDILDFARGGNGGLPVHREWVNLHELCRSTLEELQVAHPHRRLELETRGNAWGWWDPDRLAQVVGNLVGNALQHGHPDTPVHVKVEDAGTDAEVSLSVHNEGEPIAPELRATLFQPFRHGAKGKAATRSVGLGLYIVQQVARAHGGEVEVRSRPSEGTTFTLRLPRGR